MVVVARLKRGRKPQPIKRLKLDRTKNNIIDNDVILMRGRKRRRRRPIKRLQLDRTKNNILSIVTSF